MLAMTVAILIGAVFLQAEPEWRNGPPRDEAFFPIAVWLQAPRNAERYKEAGINTYVGLWEGPTEEQLAALKKAGMKVVCSQNPVALKSPNADCIIAWMHGDEPDNAQPKEGGGYGPPIPAESIAADYKRLRAADPTRPVLLNLGQGVAYDNWIGRGVRRNHPEDYAEYLKGCDIASFDIYPVVHDSKEVAGKLEFVANGVKRLRDWSGGRKIVWNCIEASRISNAKAKLTAAQVRSEVWMSIVRGSTGIIYFVHQFKPRFVEASIFDDAELLKGVTEINREIRELAPVLNGPTVKDATATAPVEVLVKKHGGATYVFAASMDGERARARIKVAGVSAEVLGEGRTIDVKSGALEDEFGAYGVHLYKVR
jgi:hypothetical protein